MFVALLLASVQAISESDMAPNILKFKYAVRGPIVSRALELKNQLKEENDLPFDEVIFCNTKEMGFGESEF